MKSKDYLIVALFPLAALLIPLVGNLAVEGWKWTWRDFVVAWVILTGPTVLYRLLATRQGANLPYRLGAGLAVAAGFLITWVNLAVQIIGDDNPGNLLYFAAILGGLVGVGLSRFQAVGLARVSFVLAAAIFLIPLVSFAVWPADFSPGLTRVCALNLVFVALFAGAGLLFRSAARQSVANAAQ